jgi:hypothetical protein
LLSDLLFVKLAKNPEYSHERRLHPLKRRKSRVRQAAAADLFRLYKLIAKRVVNFS